MSKKTKELTTKQLKAIELLSLGQLTLTDITKELGITRDTLWRWRKQPKFRQAVANRTRELLADALPEIFLRLKERAIEGDPRHIKLLLEHLDKYEDSTEEESDLTFTWKEVQ